MKDLKIGEKDSTDLRVDFSKTGSFIWTTVGSIQGLSGVQFSTLAVDRVVEVWPKLESKWLSKFINETTDVNLESKRITKSKFSRNALTKIEETNFYFVLFCL